MIFILYSDKNCEYQAIACIKSLESKITDEIKILYFTIGFQSDFSCKNLIKVETEYNKLYPTFHFYKAELCLKGLYMFPEEKYFIFSDTDILYSKRFQFENFKHENPYPLASFGPHEYPFTYETIGDQFIKYDEIKLMEYLNVQSRSLRYVWSCFYSFNRNCKDFLEEYDSMCKNKYLIDRRKWYYPFQDETSFNVLLWKRNATESLGFCFVNTHDIHIVMKIETDLVKHQYGNNIDVLGANWEYIDDSSNIMFYHGFKSIENIKLTLNYLLNEK